jgi:NAD(P)-dependent dehydrogenase (short-subunit alcohol dehydrogenase family)
MPNRNWTTDAIPPLSGNIVIITGANSGIGIETAKVLASKDAHVILACRSMEKGNHAAQQIRSVVPNAHVEPMILDLSSLKSVRTFAETFKTSHHHLHMLINNAGIMWVPYGKTEDGFERHFGTNHLGHFALTGLLLDSLLNTPGARVVTVSSLGHRSGNMDFDHLMYDGGIGYQLQPAYGRSKLANLLFTFELQRRFDAMHANALAVAAHPGVSNTNLVQYVENRWYFGLLRLLWTAMIQGSSMGALPTLRAATDPEAKGGDYFGPRGFMETRGYPVKVGCSATARDVNLAKRLWKVSEDLTGVTYGSTFHVGSLG